MKKLRVAKSRAHSTSETENDLRGLGNTDMMSDLTPEPVLTVYGDFTTELDAAHDLNIEHYSIVAATDSARHHHLHCSHPNLNHKLKTLNLFMFAILLKSKHGLNSFCWEQNRLHQALENGIIHHDSHHNHHHNHHKATPNKTSEEHHTHGLPFNANLPFENVTIDSAFQLYLQQAGVLVHPLLASEQPMQLTDDHIQSIIDHLKPKKASTTYRNSRVA
jgi:hypothetical protein